MVTRSTARLTLVLLLCASASAAWATGNFIPEMRFVSRSGQDPQNNLPYFHGRLGILRPTFDDNRLFAAYRQLMGGTFTDAQAQALLKSCCDAARAADDTQPQWSEVRKRVLSAPAPEVLPTQRNRPDDIRALDVDCFPLAYRNAAAVLTERIKQHGATFGAGLDNGRGCRAEQLLGTGVRAHGSGARRARLAQGRPRLPNRDRLFLPQ